MTYVDCWSLLPHGHLTFFLFADVLLGEGVSSTVRRFGFPKVGVVTSSTEVSASPLSEAEYRLSPSSVIDLLGVRCLLGRSTRLFGGLFGGMCLQ